jgi:hypothetical protein
MSDNTTPSAPSADSSAQKTATVDKAVAEGGAYEVLRRRLDDQGAQLRAIADALNAQRLQEFGSSRMEVVGRLRIRTEHNCVARDIVQVGDCLLFGYNVFIGLKKETRVEDIFSLYRLIEGPEGYDVTPVDAATSFLGDASFVKEFTELHAYYKNTRLLQLVVRDGKLLASFQIGERIDDIRVFRWQIQNGGGSSAQGVRYIDNRGERDIALPAPYDFEWTRATRELAVNGRHPHLNILDTVFVETLGGDLTVKIENNTEDGLGIYREPVDDQTQSLDDAQIDYARVGSLILLRVLPYRESEWRYLVYNTLSRKVHRIDAIGQACVQLPEDHGIVFPGGYMLQNGETRTFDQAVQGMRFKRTIRSPNGEDVLYLFYEPLDGRIALFVYNMIQRGMQPPDGDLQRAEQRAHPHPPDAGLADAVRLRRLRRASAAGQHLHGPDRQSRSGTRHFRPAESGPRDRRRRCLRAALSIADPDHASAVRPVSLDRRPPLRRTGAAAARDRR